MMLASLNTLAYNFVASIMIGMDGNAAHLVRHPHYPPSHPLRSMSMPASVAAHNGDDLSLAHRYVSCVR